MTEPSWVWDVVREAHERRPYPSHGEPYDARLDWPERYTDGPI